MNRSIILITSVFLALNSCDIIEGPYIQSNGNNGGNGDVLKKVLLEEFTGHQCPNCPAGAAIASQIKTLYSNRFVVIAYHAGFFARTSADFPIDYRTAVGAELNGHFGVLAYPSGMINRKQYDGSTVLDKSNWAAAAASAIGTDPQMGLTVNRQYNEATRLLSVTTTAKALTGLAPLKLCVFVTESGLISPQKTSNDPNYPSGTIPSYEHKHVFRASLNGTWGQDLFAAGAIANQSQILTAVGTLSTNWNASNMEIVVFAYSATSGEVIQVETIKVMD